MSPPAKSLFVFGIYLSALGAILVIAPNALLTLFMVPQTSEVWIRVVGMLLLFLGTYDILAAKSNLVPFITWSAPIRMSVIVFFSAFVLLGMVSPVLLLFAAIDFGAGLWTWLALRKQHKRAV